MLAEIIAIWTVAVILVAYLYRVDVSRRSQHFERFHERGNLFSSNGEESL